MARANRTKFALLGMLMHGPMSGYDLKKFSDASIAHFWSENYGHIYPILKRMETEGLAKKLVIRTKGRPARHVYSITEKGRQLFRAWLMTPPEREVRRNEFLLKLFFAGFMPSQARLDLIEFERSRNAKVLEEYQGLESRKIDKMSSSSPWKFARLTLSYGKKMGSARVQWCDEVLRKLNKKKRTG
jgi:PadR family transcriptional regulator AphA